MRGQGARALCSYCLPWDPLGHCTSKPAQRGLHLVLLLLLKFCANSFLWLGGRWGTTLLKSLYIATSAWILFHFHFCFTRRHHAFAAWSGASPDGWSVNFIITIAFPAPQLEPNWLMVLFVFHRNVENHLNFMQVPVCVRDLRKVRRKFQAAG